MIISHKSRTGHTIIIRLDHDKRSVCAAEELIHHYFMDKILTQFEADELLGRLYGET